MFNFNIEAINLTDEEILKQVKIVKENVEPYCEIAKEKIVKSYIKFAFSIVKDCTRRTVDKEDFVSSALHALTKAIYTFDADKTYIDKITGEEKPVKFTTYAARCMRNEVFMALRISKNYETKQLLIKDTSEFDADEQIERLINLSKGQPDKLDEYCDLEEKRYLIDKVKKTIDSVLNTTERDIILMKYLSGDKIVTSKEIAEFIGYSQAYTSRKGREAIKKLVKAIKVEDQKFSVESDNLMDKK